MPELDLNTPSTRYLQRLIREQVRVQLKTAGGDLFVGSLRWQDHDCLCLTCDEGEVLFWRTSLSFIRPLA